MSLFMVTKRNLLIRGLVFLILGILFISFPEEILRSISVYLGVILLISGIILIMVSLIKAGSYSKPALLTSGIVTSLFGLLFILKPAIVEVLLDLLIGLWMLFNGISQISGSTVKKEMGWKYWWIQLLGGILLLVFSLAVLFDAFSASIILTVWFGAIMIAYGVYYLIVALTGY